MALDAVDTCGCDETLDEVMRRMMHAEPEIIHSLPGRIRVHVPGLRILSPELVERNLRRVSGVRRASANPHTGNVLIQYDPNVTDPESLLSRLWTLQHPGTDGAAVEPRILRASDRMGLASMADGLWPAGTTRSRMAPSCRTIAIGAPEVLSADTLARWARLLARVAIAFLEGPVGWLSAAAELLDFLTGATSSDKPAPASVLASIHLLGPLSLTLGVRIDPKGI